MDTSNGASENENEKLEMTTFGKSDAVNCKGILDLIYIVNTTVMCTSFKGDIVSLAHFDKYVENRHQDRDKLFEAEYAVGNSLCCIKLYLCSLH